MPVLPKPPSPRTVLSSESTSRSCTALHALNHELSHLLAVGDLNRRRGVEVDGNDLNLTTIVAVDESGRVDEGQALLERAAAARLHEAGVAIRKSDRDARGNQDSRARLDGLGSGGVEVETCIPVVGVARKWQIGIESHDAHIQHAQTPRTTVGMCMVQQSAARLSASALVGAHTAGSGVEGPARAELLQHVAAAALKLPRDVRQVRCDERTGIAGGTKLVVHAAGDHRIDRPADSVPYSAVRSLRGSDQAWS